MRPAPGFVPTRLPEQSFVVDAMKRVLNRPDIRLMDRSIKQLTEGYDAWLTGSNVWMPAVFGKVLEPAGDYDVLFADEAQCTEFIDKTLKLLNKHLPPDINPYSLGETMFGSGRIFAPNGVGIIDAWTIKGSISETLMGYPYGYVRAAFRISQTIGPSDLVRIPSNDVSAPVPAPQKFSTLSRLAGPIKQMSNGGYPGRRTLSSEQERLTIEVLKATQEEMTKSLFKPGFLDSLKR